MLTKEVKRKYENKRIYSPDNRNNHTSVEYDTYQQDHSCWQISEALFHQGSDQRNPCYSW